MALTELQRDPLPLRGRAAIVTGASRRAGIGYAIARRLAALGASLFLHHYAPHDRAQPGEPNPAGRPSLTV
jgi:3-oxoacyl-[acyl-carrier protein] reductase